MLETLRVIAAIILIFFLPGFMLVQVLFPGKEELDADFDWLYRGAMAVGLSMVVTILVSFGLNSLGANPNTGMGYVTTGPITLLLLVLTGIFFGIAWFRGGFPFLGRLHPGLIRFPTRGLRDEDIPYLADRQQRFRHQNLVKQKFQLIKQIDRTERLMAAHSGDQKEYYSERRKKQLAELAELEKRISTIERGLPEPQDGIDDENGKKINYMDVAQDD
jgi:hypothetical protein